MARAFVSLVSLVVILNPQPVSAQLFETVGIRAQGMGGAFVAVADDATATWWNPAGLAAGAFFNVLVEYDRLGTPSDTSITGLALALPSLGLSYYRLPINQMRAATSTEQSASGREDQGVLSVYGVTAGQSIGRHFVVASTLKVVRAGQTHGDLDVGAMAKYGVLHVGLTVKNIREPSFEPGGGPLTLERHVRTGFALTGTTQGLVSDLALAVDADVTTTTTTFGPRRYVGGGVEVWTLGKALGFRTGGSTNTDGERTSSWGGGASLMLQRGRYLRTYLDAHVTRGSDDARSGWGAALRMTF